MRDMVPVVTDAIDRFLRDRSRSEERARNLLQALDGIEVPRARPGDLHSWLAAVNDAIKTVARAILTRVIDDAGLLALATNAVASVIIDHLAHFAAEWINSTQGALTWRAH